MLPTTPTRTDSRVNDRVADSGMTRGRVLALPCFFFLMFCLEFGPFFRVPCCAARAGYVLRSHHSDYTASHPNCEVKHCWAQSVLRWGTTRESWVSNVFSFPNVFFFPGKKKMRPIFFPPNFPVTPPVSRPCRTHLPWG